MKSPPIADEFNRRLQLAKQRLDAITETHSLTIYPDGTWTRKQVLGHLIDSSTNNHQRFVRGALYGDYTGPGYDADAWVALHGYNEMPWADLVRQWWDRNQLLARVVANVPAERYAASCAIGDEPSVTLEFVMRDYLDHLDGHVLQIVAGS